MNKKNIFAKTWDFNKLRKLANEIRECAMKEARNRYKHEN